MAAYGCEMHWGNPSLAVLFTWAAVIEQATLQQTRAVIK
jgi:hypothetical protein